MTKVVCITSKVPLTLAKVDDPSHWQLCYKGFGRGLAKANYERELQALRVLVSERCHRGSTDSLPDRLLWLYCMHVNQPLAKFALSSLS